MRIWIFLGNYTSFKRNFIKDRLVGGLFLIYKNKPPNYNGTIKN